MDLSSIREDEESKRPAERRLRADLPLDRARLSVLAEIGLLLASSDDYLTILHEVTDITVPALADWCSVHIVNPLGQLERIAIRHAEPRQVEHLPELLDRSVARVVASGKSQLAEHVADLALGVASYMCVPLIVRGRVIGVLTLVHGETSQDYHRDDVQFIEELARRVAMYVDNAMLLREVQLREAALRDEAARLETLNRIGQELAAIHDLDEVVKKVCEAATALTGAEVGLYFTTADGAPKYALCGATFEESRAVAARAGELTPANAAFQLQRALRVDDVTRAASTTNLGVLSTVVRIRSYLAVPVRGRRGDVIGGIALGHARPSAFDVRAEQLIIGLASLTATATDSARLFREARELIAALEKSNRDLDQFAHVTSHDLRAPLRGIANLANWIEEDMADRLTEKSRDHLGLLRGRVRRLEDLIQGVLDYSRAGREADEPAEMDLHALVDEVVELLAPAPTVRFKIDAHLPRIVSTRVPLQQVFMNLISNALKHTNRPDPLIEIGAEPRSEGWELFVRDNGPGIPRRYHQQVWGLFQTLHSRDRIESTGIGLAIVRRIVEAYGGHTWIDSDEGKGATFRFTWPRTPPRPRSWETPR